MNMPPLARKWYMSLLILAVGAYVVSLGYRGVRTYQRFQERNALNSNDHSDFMVPLARSIEDYTAKNNGRLPKDIPLAQLLGAPNPSAAISRILDDPRDHIQWNADIASLQPSQGGRRILLWLVDDRYPHYACAVTCTGTACTAVILPRADLQDLTGTPAKLK